MSTAATPATPTHGIRSIQAADDGAAVRASILFAQRRDHRFYLTLAILAAFMIFLGFSQTYYFKPLQSVALLPPSPKLTLLLHIHGFVYTLYVLFYLCQVALISRGRRALHMTLGWASLVLIPAMVVLGTAAVFWGAKMGHKQNWPDIESAALVNVANIYSFALLASLGILLRRRPESHRRLMSLSFITLLPPALARPPLATLGARAIVISIIAFLLAGPIYDLITRRRIHPVYAIAVPLSILTGPPARVALASAPAWHHFVHWMMAFY